MRWLKDNILTVFTWLLPSGGALVVVILALIQNVPWYLIALSVVAIVVLILFGINQYESIKDKKKYILSKHKDKKIEDTIYNWIDRTIYTVEKQPETDHFYFGLDITDPAKKPVSIFREKVRPDQITLASSVTLSDRHKIKFQSLPRSRQENIIHQLRIEMVRFGISFEGLDFPFEKVTLSDVISLNRPLDGFHLMQRAMFMRRGLALIMELMWQYLDSADTTPAYKIK